MFPQHLYSCQFSFQAVLPPKDQRDVGLDGNWFFRILVPAGDQLREPPTSLTRAREPGPGSAVPPSGWKQRQRGMQGCQAGRGPARRGQQSCAKGKLRLVLCKLKYRDQDSKGGVQRSYEESSVYLQFIFLMGGRVGSKAGGNCHEE